MESLEILAEKLLVRLGDMPSHRYPLEDLRQVLSDFADDTLFAGVVDFLSQKGEVYVENSSAVVLTQKSLGVGVKRLVRKFCRRYYGEVSPLVDERMVRAVLKRHGGTYELEEPQVQEQLKELEAEGLIRLVGKPNGYFKMLGAN